MSVKFSLFIILLFTILFNIGCTEKADPPEVIVTGSEILIANEGNFGWGEGTLSIYNEVNNEVQNEVYKAKNDEPLGNVFHSIASFNGKYFFVMNNSGKVVITDSNFIKKSEITGLTSPRNIYRVSDDKAYVTDLYADAITIIDMKSLAVIGSIPCNGHSEEGVVRDGKFWFTAPETETLYAVDIATDQINDSISNIGWMPESIILDNENRMWVLTRGDESKNKTANLSVVSTDQSHTINALEGIPTNLVYDSKLNYLYFLDDGVWKVNLNDPNDKPSLWMESGSKVYYSIKVNPANSEVYVSDVKDFVSRSSIYRYSSDKTPLDEFTTGIIAGDFFFP